MLQIRATSGASNANSYATVKEADDFFDTVYGASEWKGLSEDDKKRLLITATMFIDELPLKYSKASDSQALNFPVMNDGVTEGYEGAKRACLYQAVYLFENTDALKEAQSGAIQGVKSEGLSSISKTVTGFNMLKRWSPHVLRYLAKWLDFDLTITKQPTLGNGTSRSAYSRNLGRLWP